jgi:hypothetical protein
MYMLETEDDKYVIVAYCGTVLYLSPTCSIASPSLSSTARCSVFGSLTSRLESFRAASPNWPVQGPVTQAQKGLGFGTQC